MMDFTCCKLCPIECGGDRTKRQGLCGAGEQMEVARIQLHHFEEPFLSGQPDDKRGSGTIFFAHCSLKCVYCQNHKISYKPQKVYTPVGIVKLKKMFFQLESNGAYNINLVTPTHYAMQIIETIRLAKDEGLKIPVVWNTSGYEKPSIIEKLKGLIDIYLTDFKYYSDVLAKKYSGIDNYFLYADAALKKMIATAGKPVFDKFGMLKSGVVVRHLTLPGQLSDSKKILKYLYKTYGDSIYISIMNQFTPMPRLVSYPEINRQVDDKQYDALVNYACDLGITKALIQEGGTAKESFIPEF